MPSKRTERRLAAILAADVVGFSRLMEGDEERTLSALRSHRDELIDPNIDAHSGRIVKLMGDGMLVEFPSVVDAVQCAVAVQEGMAVRNSDVPEDERITFRIGVNLGDVIVEGEDILGDGVNVAARLEGLAPSGGLLISDSSHAQIADKIDVEFVDAGERKLKNIGKPVRVWRWDEVDDDVQASDSPPSSLPLPDKPSIAVLAFENMSPDPDQEHFADGISEDILTAISRIPDLFVIDRHSSFAYKGKKVSCQQVGQELGVRYVLEGSVRRSGPRVRITAQLIDSATGEHVWAERFDRTIEDIFAVQDEITRNIAIAMQTKLTVGEYGLNWQRDTENFEAWERMSRCFREYFRFSLDGFRTCRRLAEEAIALDPDFGSAYAVLAWSYSGEARYFSSDPEPLFEKAVEIAHNAIKFEKSRPQGLLLIAYQKLVAGAVDEAIDLFKEVISLAPNSAENHFMLGHAMIYAGEPEAAIAHTERAMRLSPFYPAYFLVNLMEAHRLSGELDNALECAKVYAERSPDSYLGQLRVAAMESLLGHAEEAEAAARKTLAMNPDFSLKAYEAVQPFKNPAHLIPLIDALRAAGLPD